MTHKVIPTSLLVTLAGLISLQVQRWRRQAAEDAAPREGLGDTSAGSDSEQGWPQVHRWSWQAEGVDGPHRGAAGSDSEIKWPQEASQGLPQEGSEQVRLGVGLWCGLLQPVADVTGQSASHVLVNATAEVAHGSSHASQECMPQQCLS